MGDIFFVNKFKALGLDIAVTSLDDIATTVEGWAGATKDRVICFSDVHGVVKGHDDAAMRNALMTADIVSPDGHPVAWIGRMFYGLPAKRACGPDFLDFLASRSPKSGLKHYFFGGKPGVAEELADVLTAKYPGMIVVGTDTPPMGVSTDEQLNEQIKRMIEAKPDVVWVGLGAPKQEIWMAQNRHRLTGITMCGIGAAFDFHTNRVKRAPLWMRERGLEWAYRAFSEPKRLGSRYAKTIPRFAWLLSRQFLQMVSEGSFRRRLQ